MVKAKFITDNWVLYQFEQIIILYNIKGSTKDPQEAKNKIKAQNRKGG